METDRTLQEAARWYARLQAVDCTEQDRLACEQWRALNAAHQRAWTLAAETAAQLDQLANADLRLRALARAALATPAEPDSSSGALRWKVPAALAASVAIAAITLRLLPMGAPDHSAATVYEAPAAAIRTVTLDDGSNVQLDVGARISVTMTPDRRQITLESGRAMFDVAHDRSRPFSVTAARSRTTALGTRFEVQLAAQQVVVTLAQGSVAIDDATRTGEWHEMLQPGEQLSVDVHSAARNKTTVDPGAVTSWTRGRHLFRGTPLHAAIDEVNRYASKKVRLGDPSLADLTVGGNFIAGDSEQIVAALAAILPLSVVNDGNKEIILFRRHDPQH